MVPPARVELATCGLGNRRSIHLSYGSKELPRGTPAIGRLYVKMWSDSTPKGSIEISSRSAQRGHGQTDNA